jgi:hypothetical protein
VIIRPPEGAVVIKQRVNREYGTNFPLDAHERKATVKRSKTGIDFWFHMFIPKRKRAGERSSREEPRHEIDYAKRHADAIDHAGHSSSFAPLSPKANVRPPGTIATSARPMAIELVVAQGVRRDGTST